MLGRRRFTPRRLTVAARRVRLDAYDNGRISHSLGPVSARQRDWPDICVRDQ